METWKEIKGFEGKYEVSDSYRIRSLPRLTSDNRGKNYLLKGRELKIILNPTGYPKITLMMGSKDEWQISIHRIIAEAFIPNPRNLPHVNHKNGVRSDYRVENLEWTSIRENLTHGRLDKKKSSKYPGVSRNNGRWMVSLFIDGKVKNLGRFDDEDVAGQVYQEALKSKGIVNKYAKVA